MKKKIVMYLTGLNLPGGKERVVSNLIENWIHEYEIILITKNDKNFFYNLPSEVKHISLNTPYLDCMFNMKKNKCYRSCFFTMNMIVSIHSLHRVLKKISYDYLYVTTPLNAFESYFAMHDAADKLVISEHASANAYNKVYSWMKKKIYPKSYCISVPNTLDVKEYKKWGCNAIFIPHLVTYHAINKNKLNTKILLNVGRLTSDKQQNLLIKMWANIKKTNGWELWIVGDGEEKKSIEKMIFDFKVESSVKIFNARKDIQNIYKKASFFALTSKSEGFGMVLIEAMSFGIPCISFDCPSGPRDIIVDGSNGFLIENQNEKLYTDKLIQIVNSSTKDLENMGKMAFQTVKKWDNEKIVSLWKSLFR